MKIISIRSFIISTSILLGFLISVSAVYAQSACTPLTTNLGIGSSGASVSQLQQYLKSQGHFTYPEITGYYGGVTAEAVEKFQIANNIVLSGTPATTGFGSVGPRTREIINKTICDGQSAESDFILGYDYNELFSYDADFDYDDVGSYDGNFQTGVSFDYESDFAYNGNLDYDANFDFGDGDAYDANFNYNLSGPMFGNNPVRARIGAADPSGRVYFAEGRKYYVESKSQRAEIVWQSEGADSCELSGNFAEGRVAVPENDEAVLFLTNPSAWLTAEQMLADARASEQSTTASTDRVIIDDFDYDFDYDFDFDINYGQQGDVRPVFAITIACREDERFGNSANDTIYVFLDEAAVQQERVENTPAPRITAVTPTEGGFSNTVRILGTTFAPEGNTITIKHNSSNGVRTITGVRPDSTGVLTFTFPSETQRFTKPGGNTVRGETGGYTITVTSGLTNKVSNAATYRVR